MAKKAPKTNGDVAYAVGDKVQVSLNDGRARRDRVGEEGAGRRIESCGRFMLSDEDILTRLMVVEDSTVERKPYADSRGWIKTAVALGNSLADGQPGLLFIGVRDNGEIEVDDTQHFEKLMKRVSGELSNIYPPIYPETRIMEKDGKKFLAVVIYGSPERPHFAGKSYRRDGTQTLESSEEHIEKFIAMRSSKVSKILKHKGQQIFVRVYRPELQWNALGPFEQSTRVLVDCNQHYVTVQGGTGVESFPLRRVDISAYSTTLILEVHTKPT